MIKECDVILKNKSIFVADYEGSEVQFTTTDLLKEDTVYIKFEKEKYSIVSKEEYEKSLVVDKKKFITEVANKKTDDK